ncbi:MAG TPA: AMIN domain-containing protein [Thermodesulfobacteriota bacterium]|nr:AMIN domain-containing protein [Thermodesulfobacteriota bacterium]
MRTFACILLLLCVSGVVVGLHGQGFASVPLLKSIRFEKSSDAEKVLFELNGFYPPEVFGLTGDQPRVVCDFKKVNLEKSLTKVMETNGTFILRIRVGIYPPPDPKIRVVVDLVPHKNYNIEQIFFQKDTTFALIIRPENANKELRSRP